jgi:aquaporin TIP
MDHEPLRRGFAEFVGTFALIFVGAGSVLISATVFVSFFRQPGGGAFAAGLALVAIALANGLVFAVMASAVGHISGGHFNPAITLGFLVTRRIAPSLAVVYWLVQFAGAALAALLLRWIFDEGTRNLVALGAPSVAGSIDHWKALVLEAILTFFLVWVVFATAADPRGAFKQISGLAIGFTITVDILVGGPLTGAAMNPARAFGPELVQRSWSDAWVWYAGPFAGGAIAALVYEYLYLSPTLRPVLPVGPPDTGVAEAAPGEAAVE